MTTVRPEDHTEYAKIDFEEKSGERVASIAAHRWSNPKRVGDKILRYLHNHLSLYVLVLENGVRKLKGIVDVTHTQVRPQIQIEADIVLKSPRSRLILRGDDGFYHLTVENGVLTTKPIPSDAIHWANLTSQEVASGD